MGSPASPAIANIFMAKLEEHALETFQQRPKTWHRYVDDVFAIVKTNLIRKLLEHLNAQHAAITFTAEVEENCQLPFMDVRVHRILGTIKTGVYRKPTHTGKYLSFSSNHPDSAKRSVVSALLRRAEYISLGETEKQLEIRQVQDELSANGYPSRFIRKVLKKTTQNTERKEDNHKKKPSTEATASIPYVRGVSEQISRILARLQISTVMKPTKWKWSLMHNAKDTIPPQEDQGVVYALGCTGCSKVYMGKLTEQRNNGYVNISAMPRQAIQSYQR